MTASDDDEEPEPPAGPRSPAGTTVVGAAGPAPGWSPAAATPRVVQRSRPGVGVGVVERVVTGLRVGVDVGVRGLDSLGVGGSGVGVVGVVRRRRSPRGPRDRSGPGSSPRAAASRLRSSSMKSSNRSRMREGVYATRSIRAGRGLRRPGRTPPGPSPPARSGASPSPAAGSKRKASRSASGTRHGRAGSSGGAISPSRIWSLPVVLEDQAARARR